MPRFLAPDGVTTIPVSADDPLPVTFEGGGGEAVAVTSLPSAQRSTLNTLLTAGADRSIPAGRRSYTAVVSSKAGPGSPTVDGVEIPAVGTYTWSAPVNDTLAAATVATAVGDVVFVMELF